MYSERYLQKTENVDLHVSLFYYLPFWHDITKGFEKKIIMCVYECHKCIIMAFSIHFHFCLLSSRNGIGTPNIHNLTMVIEIEVINHFRMSKFIQIYICHTAELHILWYCMALTNNNHNYEIMCDIDEKCLPQSHINPLLILCYANIQALRNIIFLNYVHVLIKCTIQWRTLWFMLQFIMLCIQLSIWRFAVLGEISMGRSLSNHAKFEQ